MSARSVSRLLLQQALLIGVVAPATVPLHAQKTNPPLVTVAGTSEDTYVLIAGMLGGIAGLHKLETRLTAAGYRVISIDPYAMSVDSADVTFAAMARRVERVLDRLHVTDAHVLGHAHGAGVALRLAAVHPERVRELVFLDAGAFTDHRSANMSMSIRLAPYLARLPGGRTVIRHHLAAGLREHSGMPDWLNADTERRYVDPVVDNIDKATALAIRLCAAREPDDVSELVAHLHAPVTVILGEFPHTSSPDSTDVIALRPLGSRLFVERLAGVGHFPNEEVPDVVTRILLTPRVVAARRP